MSTILKYVKDTTIPGNNVNHRAITASPAGLNICSEYVVTGEHFKNLEVNQEGPDQLDLCFNIPVFNVNFFINSAEYILFPCSSSLLLERKGMGGSFSNYLFHLVNKHGLIKGKEPSQMRRVLDMCSFLGSVDFIAATEKDFQPAVGKSISLHDLQDCWLSSGLVFNWYN